RSECLNDLISMSALHRLDQLVVETLVGQEKEGDRTLLALIGQHLHERDPRGIVDADMDELPTDAVVTVDRARISPGDAVAHRADSAELFDIEMDELARMLAFITPYRFGRLQGTELVQSQPT